VKSNALITAWFQYKYNKKQKLIILMYVDNLTKTNSE
jgi:hypothetical protein